MSAIVNFFSSIIAWIVSFWGNPATQTVVRVVKAVAKQLPDGLLERAMALVAEAATKDVDNEARFLYVFNNLKNEYPDLAENTIRAFIENILLVHKGN